MVFVLAGQIQRQRQGQRQSLEYDYAKWCETRQHSALTLRPPICMSRPMPETGCCCSHGHLSNLGELDQLGKRNMCTCTVFGLLLLSRSQLKRLSSCPFGWVKRDLGGHLDLESREVLKPKAVMKDFLVTEVMVVMIVMIIFNIMNALFHSTKTARCI